jgi:hypothetical protein
MKKKIFNSANLKENEVTLDLFDNYSAAVSFCDP